jgi:peptidoglycan hydrolase CwlO-like protein
MFDQNNRVKLTLGLLLAVYSLGASQGAIKSKITEHLDEESAVKAELDSVKDEVGSLKVHVVTNSEDIEELESSNRSTKKQIHHFHKDEIGR